MQAPIYPIIPEKYQGRIHYKHRVYYVKIVNNGRIIFNDFFDRKEDAFNALKQCNIDECLKIRNIIYPYKEWYRLEDHIHGEYMDFDPDKLDYIQANVVYFRKDTHSNRIIAFVKVGSRYKFLHNVFMNKDTSTPGSVDHINMDSLDNRLSNLRITSPQTQQINRKVFKNSLTGITGVTKRKHVNKDGIGHFSYYAEISINGVKKTKSFSIQKHGKNEAFRLACVERSHMEDESQEYQLACSYRHPNAESKP